MLILAFLISLTNPSPSLAFECQEQKIKPDFEFDGAGEANRCQKTSSGKWVGQVLGHYVVSCYACGKAFKVRKTATWECGSSRLRSVKPTMTPAIDYAESFEAPTRGIEFDNLVSCSAEDENKLGSLKKKFKRQLAQRFDHVDDAWAEEMASHAYLQEKSEPYFSRFVNKRGKPVLAPASQLALSKQGKTAIPSTDRSPSLHIHD